MIICSNQTWFSVNSIFCQDMSCLSWPYQISVPQDSCGVIDGLQLLGELGWRTIRPCDQEIIWQSYLIFIKCLPFALSGKSRLLLQFELPVFSHYCQCKVHLWRKRKKHKTKEYSKENLLEKYRYQLYTFFFFAVERPVKWLDCEVGFILAIYEIVKGFLRPNWIFV